MKIDWFDKKTFVYYVCCIIIEKTIDIQPNHRLVFDLPIDLPTGKAWVKLTIISEKKVNSGKRSAFGCLGDFADPAKIPDEENAWEQAVMEKYAEN